MKKTSKKLLSIILAMLMVITTIPTFAITALAEANPTVLNITLDLDTSVQLGTKPADYKISDAYLSDYSDNCEDFGYEGLPYFFLANNQCYGTTGEGAPKGTAIYPDEKGNQWCWMNGPYTEGNRYGNMIFISDSDLETKPDKFNVNGVLYNVLDFNGWYYCLLDLGVVDSTGKLSGGDFDCKHTYGTKGDSRYTCQTCGEIDKEKQTEALLADAKHKHSYKKTIVKAATYNATGKAKYTCSCGKTKTETIPRLNITSTVKYNNSTKLDSAFKVTTSTKDVTAKWGKVADADGYIVYAAYCGKDFKAIKTIKGSDTTSYSFTKLAGKKLNLNKNIKVYVKAYVNVDGKKVELGKSISGHVIGGWSRTYTNPTKVTVKNNKVTLAKGKTSTIKATVTYKYANKKHLSDAHAAEKRYRSSNKAVATVDANGKIKAVGKGTCTIYVYAKNGTSTKVTVTVKENKAPATNTTPEIFKDGAQVQLGFYNVYSKVNIETSFVFKDNKYEFTKYVFDGVDIPLDKVNSSGLKAEKKGDVFSFCFGQYPDANGNLQDCYLIIDTKAKTYKFDMDKNDVYVTHILVNGKDIAKDMKSITGKNLQLPFRQE